MNTQSLHVDGSIEEIIDMYTKMVYGIALSHTNIKADADDIFQDVFLTYFQKKPLFNDEEHRKAWLIRTTLNFCKKTTLSSWRKKTIYIDETQNENQTFEFTSKEENIVYTTLRELPQKYRIVLYLFYFEELSIKEISVSLGIKEGTIRMQLTRGREIMREKLKGDYFYE